MAAPVLIWVKNDLRGQYGRYRMIRRSVYIGAALSARWYWIMRT